MFGHSRTLSRVEAMGGMVLMELTLTSYAVLWLILILIILCSTIRISVWDHIIPLSTLRVFLSSLPATWAQTAAPWSPSLTTSTLSCPALKSPHRRPRSFTRKSTLLLRGVRTSHLTAVFLWIGSSELVLKDKTGLVTQDISRFIDLKLFHK